MDRWKRALAASSIATDSVSLHHQLRAPAEPDDFVQPFGPHGETPISWVLSSVSTFQVRYSPPVSGLSLDHSIEALVEGSEMSLLREGKSDNPYLPLTQFKPLESPLTY